MPKSRRARFLLTSLLLFAAANVAHAGLWFSYEIDSLIDQSPLIVEAEITAVKDANSGTVQVRVSRVLRGTDAKVDDALLISALHYKKPGPNISEGKPLEVGDRLFWFLKLAPDSPSGSRVWLPLPGGAKLVFGGHVAEFSQQMNPGDAIAEIEPGRAPKNQPTLEEYRTLIADSIRGTAKLKSDISNAAHDSKKLVALLRQRVNAVAGRPGADLIAGTIGQALIELHDCDALVEATAIPGVTPYAMRTGFATPEGVEYLLTRISDQKIPAAQRLAFLNLLPTAHQLQNPDGTLRPEGFYFVRLAKLAIDNAQDASLTSQLIQYIEAGSGGQHLDRAGQQNVEDAIALLKGLYDSTKSESLRFAIELATRPAGLDAYEKLNSKCGPIISMATVPDDLRNYAKPLGRDLIAGLQYAFFFPEQGSYTVQDQPILENVATGKAYPATFNTAGSFDPAIITCGNGSRSGFTALIAVPPEAPAGRYRLYFIIRQENKIISQSHAVEVTVAAN